MQQRANDNVLSHQQLQRCEHRCQSHLAFEALSCRKRPQAASQSRTFVQGLATWMPKLVFPLSGKFLLHACDYPKRSPCLTQSLKISKIGRTCRIQPQAVTRLNSLLLAFPFQSSNHVVGPSESTIFLMSHGFFVIHSRSI